MISELTCKVPLIVTSMETMITCIDYKEVFSGATVKAHICREDVKCRLQEKYCRATIVEDDGSLRSGYQICLCTSEKPLILSYIGKLQSNCTCDIGS